MNRMSLAGSALTAMLMLSTPAFAQAECATEGAIRTQASCGGDACSCAAPCDETNRCKSGCCHEGFCALECVCDGQGTVTADCSGVGGCGTVAPSPAPLGGGMAMLWGFGLIGVGLVGSGRFIHRSGLRSPVAIASLSLALLGATLATATAFEKSPTADAKALAQR